MPNYNLIPGSVQDQFLNSRAKFQMFGGGYGNGKTTALVMKALGVAIDYPGANMLLARSTFPKLNDTLRKEFLRWCPPDWIRRKPTQEDNTCYLVNGTAINFRYVAQRGKQNADGSTTSNLLSATYDFVGVDQVEDPEITEKDFLDLLGRLRGQTPYRGANEDVTMPSSGPRWIVLTCNPTHNWVYQKLVKPFMLWRDRGIKDPKLIVDELTGIPIMELFEDSTYGNAHNLPEDFIKAQEAAYKGQMRDRFLLGKWASYEGLVHPGFSMENNVINYDEILGHLEDCVRRHVKVQVLEGYDFGIASPSCYILGFVDDFGRVFLLDGYYEPEFPYTKQPDRMREIREKYSGLLNFKEPLQADPDLFRRKIIQGHNTGTKLSDVFEEMGIDMVPASNDIIAGIAKVNAYIDGLPVVPDFTTGVKPGSMLYASHTLTWFMDEIMGYFWKKNPLGEVTDEPIDNKDHAMNTIKYMLSHLPAPSDIVVARNALPPEWMFWRELEVRQ